MWFICGLLTALFWGGADLFYKKGSDSSDKLSHLKITIMVGLVMGVHALIYMLVIREPLELISILKYLPVSFLYILSMVLGYVGLRYIELSVASPIQNSSGAVVAILCLIFFSQKPSALSVCGIVIVSVGVVLLAVLEKRGEPAPTEKDKKYRISAIAIMFPILYCIIDGMGTFADALYLDELGLITENQALLAYEFTFFIIAIVLLLYITLIKKQKFTLRDNMDRGIAAVLETGGQFFYVFAMAKNAVITAPLIASYSIFSVILSRIFLKEKLSRAQYAVVIAVLIGIAIMGVADEL